MKTYVNQSNERRVWPGIQIPTTGRTLELAPGETAYLDLPDDFTDFALVPFVGGVKRPSPTMTIVAEVIPTDTSETPTPEEAGA